MTQQLEAKRLFFSAFHFRDRVSSDDAQVDAHMSAVAPKIPGNVLEVLVKDNQYAVVRPRVEVDALIALDRSAPWL